jgi:hypothetical protein
MTMLLKGGGGKRKIKEQETIESEDGMKTG